MMDVCISDAEFRQFRDLMYKAAGVYLADSKKQLVSGRLLKRLRERNQTSFADYYRLVSSSLESEEFHCMMDLLTTHETYFFREPQHFNYLASSILPSLSSGHAPRIWSAASSTGEEAYSLAMVLMDKLGANLPWQILGSDISQKVVATARLGIYSEARSEGLPNAYRQRFCLRGIQASAGTLRVAPELRERVQFAEVNLNASLVALGQFDVVFLRNVLIYFDAPTKRQIVERILQQIRPHGWLIVGHSESLNGVVRNLQQVRPTVYRKGSV